jgi:hypothetical protein
MSGNRTITPILLISGCLAIFTCLISGNLSARFAHHAEAVHNQLAILKGEPHIIDGVEKRFPQFQSRILFPLLLTAATQIHILSASQWFIFLRIATAFVAFAVFQLLCTRSQGIPVILSCLGAGALAYALVFTFNHPWEHPTDFLDVVFFSGFIWLTIEKRRAALALLVLLATLNHQTAAFGAVIWFCVRGLNSRSRPMLPEAVYAGSLVAGSYALSTAIKSWLGHDKSISYVVDGWQTIPQLIDALRHPQPYSWPILLVAMALPASLWLWSNRTVVTGEIRRLVWAAVWIVVLSSPIAYWSELRSVFLAPMVVLTFATVASENRMRRTLASHDLEAISHASSL